jgi:hypothetical protein
MAACQAPPITAQLTRGHSLTCILCPRQRGLPRRAAATRDRYSRLGDSEAGDSEAGDSEAGDSDAGDSAAGDSDAGDSAAGDSAAGDSEAGDSAAGDSEAGDSEAGVLPSRQRITRQRGWPSRAAATRDRDSRLGSRERSAEASDDSRLGRL